MNVRAGPGSDFDVVGALRQDDCIYFDAYAVYEGGYYWLRMAIDGPVLAATVVLVTMAAILAGALPAWRAMQADPAVVLRSSTRTRGVGRAGTAFLGVQIGAATAALVGAALLGSGLGQWSNWTAFLPPEPLVVATIDLTGTPYQGRRIAGRAEQDLLDLPILRWGDEPDK